MTMVRYFKENEKGVESMCRVLEDMRNEVAKETAERVQTDIINKMLQSGKLTVEEIANMLGLSVGKVMGLSKANPM